LTQQRNRTNPHLLSFFLRSLSTTPG
jgi:hypothetical protein